MAGLGKFVPLPRQPDQKGVQYGHGKREEEERCPHIDVFMRCVGHFRSGDTKRVQLAPSATIENAREAFGRNMKQEVVLDERNFEIDSKLHREPLATFSSGCKLNLNFTYKHQGTDALVEIGEGSTRALWQALISSFSTNRSGEARKDARSE